MQEVLRPAVLRVADTPSVERFFRESAMTRELVDRFVAGETLDEAMVHAGSIARQGMGTTLDLLGENVESREAVAVAVGAYADMLRRLADNALDPNISVKLTMLGLDLGDDIAESAAARILEVAREVGGFVRVDMEGSAYTERTLRIVERLHGHYPEQVGAVIQAMLYRSGEDVERLIARGMRVRLVKGAYAEPATVAWRKRSEIDAAYVRLMERLLDNGAYPAIATHDPALVRAAIGYTSRMNIPADRFEFQMLFGVRRDAQAELVRDGYRMRVYVPFGAEWYAYFSRRIAERPANALFVLRQLAG